MANKPEPFPFNDWSCCRNHGIDISLVLGESWTWLSDEEKRYIDYYINNSILIRLGVI